jgi:D-glycero-alpha-D-manno-heptose-7-phosphate kinase
MQQAGQGGLSEIVTITSRTPYRVSLFGGGTDYPAWVARHGGAVLGMAIDKYCHITLRPMADGEEEACPYRVIYARDEQVGHIADIQHPAVRAVYGELGVGPGLELRHEGDLPARSGLGSSSSFTVGLLHALKALRGERPCAAQLAAEAIRIEQQVIGENVGCQDQVWAAHGGLNHIRFTPDGRFHVRPLSLSPARREELLASTLMVFTGQTRIASDVAGEQIDNIDRREQELHRIAALVDPAAELLADEREPMHRLGELLHESWMLKRELASRVSNAEIDAIYEQAMAAGATGGKLLGAGNGGFMLFLVPPERRAGLARQLGRLTSLTFAIAPQGSHILVRPPAECAHHAPAAMV